MLTDFTSTVLFVITGLLLTSLALLRARALRAAKTLSSKSVPEFALSPAALLRDSAH